MPDIIKVKEDGMYLSVRVQPGAKRTALDGSWNNTHLKIVLQAPAIDGKANGALIDFLSEKLRIKKKNIFIVTGQTSRCKVVFIKINDTDERTRLDKWWKQEFICL